MYLGDSDGAPSYSVWHHYCDRCYALMVKQCIWGKKTFKVSVDILVDIADKYML